MPPPIFNFLIFCMPKTVLKYLLVVILLFLKYGRFKNY